MVFLDKVKNMLKMGKVLYYPGCVSKFKQKEIVDNYKKLLKRLGIDFVMLEIEELCCGLPLLNSGYKDSFEKIIEKNKLIFKNQKITKIITNCPACTHIFKKYYNIETEHIIETIANNIRKIELEQDKNKLSEEYDKEILKERITLHIPCYMMKDDKLIEKVKELIKKQNYNIKVLDENFCCGTGHSPLRKTNLTRNVSRLTLDKTKTNKLLTLCPLCYEHFDENNKSNLEILELSDLFKHLEEKVVVKEEKKEKEEMREEKIEKIMEKEKEEREIKKEIKRIGQEEDKKQTKVEYTREEEEKKEIKVEEYKE